MRRAPILFTLLILLALPALPAVAADAQPAAYEAAEPCPSHPGQLVIGTTDSPPFSMPEADGGFTGLSVELFKDIAKAEGWEICWKGMTLKELLDALASGAVDVGVGALTTTAERERRFNFTQPYYQSGLGIAVPHSSGAMTLLHSLSQLMSTELLVAVLVLFAGLLVMGWLIWRVERKTNPADFPPGLRGILHGMWWSAVTTTTVGYGDVVPRSHLGRMLGVIWMLVTIGFFSLFTAHLASTLTVHHLNMAVRTPQELARIRVMVVRGTSGQDFLRQMGLRLHLCDTLKEALQAVADGNADAAVHDRPILRWYVTEEFNDTLQVLDVEFDPQNYALGLPNGSPLRETLDFQVLYRVADSDFMHQLERSYLGE